MNACETRPHHTLASTSTKDIALTCVGLFVGDSVGLFVGDFVGDSVGLFVGDCTRDTSHEHV